MNIREFAQLCGVTPTTVSRVLNNTQEKSHASKKTYEMIHSMAEDVGFRLNYYAQAFNSKRSNCMGFIMGGWTYMLAEPLLFGISKVLNLQRKNLAVYPCDSSPKCEAEALEKMLSYNAEAVFLIPSIQKGKKYSTAHIRKALDRHPQFPPVVAVYGGTDIPEFYQVSPDAYETGKSAALRQLGKKCRSFGIMLPMYSNFMNREMARGYRETLLGEGVPESAVKSLFVWPKGVTDEDYASFKGVDGILCSHYMLMLKHVRPLTAQIGGSRNLHVDCMCGTETEILHKGLLPISESNESKDDFPGWFASMVIHKYSLRDIGAKAAEIAVRLGGPEAADVPKNTFIGLKAVSFSN